MDWHGVDRRQRHRSIIALHGSQKLLGVPGGKDPVQLASLMGLAGVIELVGGIMIALGLFAGIAAFIASGEMAAAYFMAHVPHLVCLARQPEAIGSSRW